MKSKFGSKALSLLLSAAMVISMVPAMTLPAGAAVLPPDANTPGKGYYPNASWDTSVWGDTEPKTDDYRNRTLEDWKKLYSNITIVNSLSFNQLLSNGVYYLDHNVTVQRPNNSYSGQSGLRISGDVTLILANNATLTVTGAPASGQNTGGGAGIELSSGNTLHIVGTGTVNAYGGSAGQDGQGYANYNNYGGAGIGTRGGAGGGGGGTGYVNGHPGSGGGSTSRNDTEGGRCVGQAGNGTSGGTGSYYYRSGISGGSGNNYTIWPKDECKFELTGALTMIENGTKQANFTTICKIAVALKMKPSELVRKFEEFAEKDQK